VRYRRFVLTIALAAGAATPAWAETANPYEFFDSSGHPNAKSDALTDELKLPRLVEGAPFLFPDRQAFEGKTGCVSAAFLIGADGHTDKFVVIDSRPKGLFDSAVLDSLKFWKFDTQVESGWVMLRIPFKFAPTVASRIGVEVPVCAKPMIKLADNSFPAKPAAEIKPFYPPALAQNGTQGCAVIAFSVVKGQADDYEIVDTVPEGEKAFAQASILALNRYHFADGAAPATRGFVHFTFGLERGNAPGRACKPPAAAAK
jgi:hypothetical protein